MCYFIRYNFMRKFTAYQKFMGFFLNFILFLNFT